MEDTYVESWKKVEDDYERWETKTKNSLVSNDVWDIIEAPSTPTQDNAIRKNATALNIIQQSCGSKNFDEVRRVKTAKEAWNRLKDRYSSDELKAKPDIEQGIHVFKCNMELHFF